MYYNIFFCTHSSHLLGIKVEVNWVEYFAIDVATRNYYIIVVILITVEYNIHGDTIFKKNTHSSHFLALKLKSILEQTLQNISMR